LSIALALVGTGPLAAQTEASAKFHIGSKDFKNGGPIPDLYTCQGKNQSPELFWKNAPAKTQSFALVVEDPDAPLQTWVHWMIYNIPVKKGGPDANTYELTEGFPRTEIATGGILQGLNDFRKIGYDGPCPPSGIHRYYFKLYALNAVLPVGAGLTEQQLLVALKGHVLAQTQVVGTYGK
jgi:Raf kinase inhibitor-like YbhB/YbcL family protein